MNEYFLDLARDVAVELTPSSIARLNNISMTLIAPTASYWQVGTFLPNQHHKTPCMVYQMVQAIRWLPNRQLHPMPTFNEGKLGL